MTRPPAPLPPAALPAATPVGAAAIRHHYDVGNAFYRLWLDDSMTYSCALPDGPDDTLEAAQERKVRLHTEAVRADRASAVLDVGCGWGSVLARLATVHGVPRSVGLTLSEEQADHVRSRAHPGVEVHTESWTTYEPDTRFDGIVSIGALEHFARPQDGPAEKVARYRDFLTRCRGWLAEGGRLSLQSVVYADMDRAEASTFMQREIFPDADLPTLTEIVAAAEGMFEIEVLRGGRLDYAWTCEQWAGRLRRRRAEAVALAGPDTVARFERYLRLSALGFRMGRIGLVRLVLRPYAAGRFRRTDRT